MFVKSAIISVDIIGKAMVLVRLAAIRFLRIYLESKEKQLFVKGHDFTFRARKVKNSSAMKNVRKIIEAVVG
jgi:hypothetical protein